jgi:hypothetical protein
MKVCESSKGQVITDKSLAKLNFGKDGALKAMINLPSRNMFAVADSIGNIYLLDSTSAELEVVKILSNETGA